MTELIDLEPGILRGVTAPTIKKILDAGITTVEGLARQTPKQLAESAGIGEDTAESAISKAITLISRGYITGSQLHEETKNRTRLTTGSKLLDDLLGGGVESETTLEISGQEGSGKTQICHTLAVRAQLPIEEGGLDGMVLWIDTENTFHSERIIEIAESLGLDPEVVLDNIIIGRAYSTPHQKMLINQLEKQCHDNNVKLIVIDSMMAHLRSEYVGRGMLAERQNELGQMLHRVAKVCRTYKITAVYTNQVMDNPGVLYGNPEKSVGGHIMGHAATTRIHIRKAKDPKRIILLMKSPYLPYGEAPIIISSMGIEDV